MKRKKGLGGRYYAIVLKKKKKKKRRSRGRNELIFQMTHSSGPRRNN